MRIVHFSDIHVGCLTRDLTAVADKRAFGLLNYYLRRHRMFDYELVPRAIQRIHLLSPDVVVCTGDLTCVGSPEEFDRARRMLRPLVGAGNWTFLYVPGNHDAYVRSAACTEALQRTFLELNSERWGLTALPCEFRMRDLTFMLVNEARPRAPWLSTGGLGPDAVEALTAWFRAPRRPGEKRILAGHFPSLDARGKRLSPRRRFDQDRSLSEALRSSQIDVALCGHIHRPFRRDESGGALEICAGSLTATGILSVLDYVPEADRFAHFWVDVKGGEQAPAPVAKAMAPAGAVE